MRHRVTLLLGCNVGDKQATLHHAITLLRERVGDIVACSKLCLTQAWGFQSEELFANQAVILTTDLAPETLLDATQAIEAELGRDREQERLSKAVSGELYCSRTMDIDIMFYDDDIISTSRLSVPHPLMQEREFALEPLCELESDRVHPVLGTTLKELYKKLKQ